MKRVILLLATIALSVGIAYAEGVVVRHNFHEMYNNGSMTVNTSTKIAAIGSFTYTYSGGTYSRFNYDSSLTGGKICLQLYGNGAKVITTSIQNIDSLAIHYYYPGDDVKINGLRTVKLPAAGDYMLKIERWDDIWLEQIDYVTSPPCNCLRVQIE